MTYKKSSVQRAKLEAYIRKGTCSECHCSIVWNVRGLCRRCLPIVDERLAQAAEAREETVYFHYWLLCRKKDKGDIGVLARTILEVPRLRRLVGLDDLASKTTSEIDVKVLEEAWSASEAERAVRSA